MTRRHFMLWSISLCLLGFLGYRHTEPSERAELQINLIVLHDLWLAHYFTRRFRGSRRSLAYCKAAIGQTFSTCLPPPGSSKGPGKGLAAFLLLPKQSASMQYGEPSGCW